MRLITGPPGAGKTSRVLEEFADSLRSGKRNIRLLVPTATLAQHFQNRLAREGFVFPFCLVDTLSGFVNALAGDPPQVPAAVLPLIVERSVRQVDRPEFRNVAQLPGFRASLARTIEELSSAGCDSSRLEACLPPGPLSAAFLAVYQEVDRQIAARGFALRAARFAAAAKKIQSEGVGAIQAVWLDGFHALPDPELQVLAALDRQVDLTLTLGDSDFTPEVAGRLPGFRREYASRPRPIGVTALMQAPTTDREVEEIARRILEQAAAGRPFREIGIVVRAGETYVPILRTTLERFGIPARFYFDSPLQEHPVTRFLAGAVDAMLAGWDHAETLAVLRLAPGFADSRAMDDFDFAVREQIPNNGLGGLKALLLDGEARPRSEAAGRILRQIEALAAIEEWRAFSLSPADWAARLRTLRALFQPWQFRDGIPHEEALLWRSQAAALDLFDEALSETELALDPSRPVELTEFWRAAKSVLGLTPMRLRDGRRNVVHVLSAPEARQWVLPVVFVCGMVEKQFPRFHQQDPFFSEAARGALNRAGIRVRTAAEFEREEQSLFESAATRAILLTTLSYPEFDSRGERNLPSIFLEGLPLAPQESRPVRPLPRRIFTPAPAPLIHTPRLLESLRQNTAHVGPTSLEMFLQCPFQYFAGRTLRLTTTPVRPEDRLDFKAQGDIVHQTLAAWYANPIEIATFFEEVFERICGERRIPVCYHSERLRNAMLADLQAFAADGQWPRNEFRSQVEEKFSFALDSSLEIKGRIDRIDTALDGRAYIVDYKYSAAQRTKAKLENENLLQPALYLLAAEKALGARPAGMFYIGLKGGVQYVGWTNSGILGSAPLKDDWLANAANRALAAAAEIRSGRIAPQPAEADNCRFCDFRDVCRIELAGAPAEEVETVEASLV